MAYEQWDATIVALFDTDTEDADSLNSLDDATPRHQNVQHEVDAETDGRVGESSAESDENHFSDEENNLQGPANSRQRVEPRPADVQPTPSGDITVTATNVSSSPVLGESGMLARADVPICAELLARYFPGVDA